MPRRRAKQMYERVFFDRLLLVGIIMLSVSYIMRGTWAGVFAESITVGVGFLWTYRAATTNPGTAFRLLATFLLVLIGSLLALYLGQAQGLSI
jgi:hypothetical protein